jgi:hypothetical protein
MHRTHAAQIDLRFGGPAREFLDFGGGLGPGDFARERFHFLGQDWIGTNGQAQTVAKRISRCVRAARAGFWAGAGFCVCALCLELACAGHDRRFGPADFTSSV